MRIGICLSEGDAISQWELAMLNFLSQNSSFELVHLIEDTKSFRSSYRTSVVDKLLDYQIKYEQTRYLKYTQVNNDLVKNLACQSICFEQSNHEEILSVSNLEEIRKLNLDLILSLQSKILTGKILDVTRFGVFGICFGEYFLTPKKLLGFREVNSKEPVVKISIIKFQNDFLKAKVIRSGYYNRHKASFVSTNWKMLSSFNSLLIKSLKDIESNDYDDKYISLEPRYFSIGLLDLSSYLFGFYKHLFNGILRKYHERRGVRFKYWTLFFSSGNFLETNYKEIKPVQLPLNEYWADPFLFEYKDESYVFFENYGFESGLGKISCAKIDNSKLVNISDVLDLDYHLSYPFIFEDNGDVFMVPETSQNRRLEIYKCTSFPLKWELYTTAFEGQRITDSSIFKDDTGKYWLFLNKMLNSNADNTSELYIYLIDSLKLTSITPHNQNPVIIDSRVARNGGAIFKYKNNFYRPSQVNKNGIYGAGLNINKIEKLSLDNYSESIVQTAQPNIEDGFISMHHLHQIDGKFVFDAAHSRIEKVK